jgi:hypothetical protein
MAKYEQAVIDKALKAAKNGMELKSVQKEFGPNPGVIKRAAKKQGVVLPKKERVKKEKKEKSERPKKDVKKK